MGGLDKADVPLVEQVFERQTHVPVFAGDLDYETEVRFDQIVVGRNPRTLLTHPTCDCVLFLLRQEGVFADLVEIARDAGVAVGRALRHLSRTSFPACLTRVGAPYFFLDFISLSQYISVKFMEPVGLQGRNREVEG